MGIAYCVGVGVVTLVFGSTSLVLAASNESRFSTAAGAPVDGARGNVPSIATATSREKDATTVQIGGAGPTSTRRSPPAASHRRSRRYKAISIRVRAAAAGQ
jgi:hypothetical protein